MAGQYPGKFKKRPENIFNDWRQMLPRSIKPVEGASHNAILYFESSCEKDKVYLKINDSVYGKDDDNYKLKSVHLDMFTYNSIFETLKIAAEDENFTSKQMTLSEKSFKGDDYRVEARITIFKDNKKRIRLTYQKSTYKVTFLMISPKVLLSKKTGDDTWEPDLEFTSKLYTLSFVKAATDYFNSTVTKNYRPWVKDGERSKPNNDYDGGDDTEDDDDDEDYD